MAINLAEKYSTKVDERFKLAALTNAVINRDYDFVGVKTVKVYSVNTVALGDYTRTGANRYGTPAELADTVQEMTMTQDKSFTFTVDKGNDLQQMGIKAAGAALRREIDEEVVPAMDKYILGKIIAGAGTESAETTITEANAYKMFLAGQEVLTEKKVPLAGRIALVTPSYFTKVKLDPNFIKNADLGQEMVLTGQVGKIDGVPLIVIPTSYFTANYDFVITHPVVTTAPVQLSEFKVHDNPPGISGALVEGRVIYDAFVLENKKNAIYAHKHAAA